MNLHCVNCNGSHPPYFHSCSKWVEKVQHIRTVNNIYPEAQKLFPFPTLTFAALLYSTSIVVIQIFVFFLQPFFNQMKVLMLSMGKHIHMVTYVSAPAENAVNAWSTLHQSKGVELLFIHVLAWWILIHLSSTIPNNLRLDQWMPIDIF